MTASASRTASTWDAIVVGSGANGGVAAKTLSTLGLRVLVLEAGHAAPADDREAWGAVGRAAHAIGQVAKRLTSRRQGVQSLHPTYWVADPDLFVDDIDNPYTTPDETPFHWIRCRVLGGRTHVWDGVMPRMSDHEFLAADRDGVGPRWPLTHADLAPYYAALERYFGVAGARDGLSHLPDGEFVDRGELTPAEQTFARRTAIDFPERHLIVSRGLRADRGGGGHPGSRPLSNIDTTLADASRTGRTTLRTGAIASRVLMHQSGHRARGVEYVDAATGETMRVEAPLVVLCASTIETVRLLLNSASSSAGHPHGLGADGGALGHYLMDHIAGNVFFQLPDITPRAQPYPLRGGDSFLVPRYQNLGEHASQHLRGFGLWGAIDRAWFPSVARTHPNESFGFMSFRGEVLPAHENTIEIDEGVLDRWGIPCARIRLRWGENDLAIAAEARRHAVELVEAAGGEVADFTHWLVGAVSVSRLRALEREWRCATPGLFVHELGGARMGSSPEGSVVDPEGAVWGIPNLLVTDGACWPTTGWQNPTLTEMAITARACGRAVARLHHS